MRNNEERIAAVKRRIVEIEKQKKQRRGRMIAVSAVAACLVVIVGLANLMPGVVGKITASTYPVIGTAASIFGGSVALGYIVIALLAFALGVCVTILCFRIRLIHREGKEDENRVVDSDGRID